ncbi:hypothetical protein OG520_45015 (plasmid) [Streptomyces sp. NBC_00984]|uniref:hypothetical protein n=1 Tax=Streptomyces sp. NBC_00984 TaxID=2903700 RepID=UPI002F90C01B|nr:hypothetical protein OG520_45015 [Streptomyces sp. NBC_00984]
MDLTRQLKINDVEGEHDHYVQVHCELRYSPQASLRDLGSFDAWFFHDADGNLDIWTASLSVHLELLQDLEPVEISLYEEAI